jgi:glycerol-3-phosphate responsive antiterminator
MRLKYKKNMSNCLPTNFKNSFLIFRHLIDISSYITLFKQFEIIKKILINQNLLPGEHNFEKKEEITIIKKNKGK